MKFLLLMILICAWASVSLANDQAIPEDLRAAAEAGDAQAQLSLAFRYFKGDGGKKDYQQAMRWAHLAADQGNTTAMDLVGWMFYRGNGVPRNADIALGYFKASAKDCAQGAWNLGQCYFAAQGTEHDIPQALKAWQHAASLGHGRAAANVAMVYLSGEGVASDAKMAKKYAEQAVALNDPSGYLILGELEFQAGNLKQARQLWQTVAATQPTQATSQPEQPSDQLAAQQGADLLKLIPYRTKKAEHGKQVVLPFKHIHQGWNNCGATSCAMFARDQGKQIGGWDYKKLCPSPLGTGTDWADLVAASKKIDLQWKLITFPDDEDGFAEATQYAKNEIDAGRPLVIDFKYIGPQYPGGEAGHTLTLIGYLAQENIYVLCNPALPTPGLQLISADDLKKYWRSDHYSRTSNNVMSRPAIVIE